MCDRAYKYCCKYAGQLFGEWLRLLGGQIFARKIDDEHVQVLFELIAEHRKALGDLVSILLDFAFLQLLEQVCVVQRFVQQECIVALHVDAQYLRDSGNHVDATFTQFAFLREEAY